MNLNKAPDMALPSPSGHAGTLQLPKYQELQGSNAQHLKAFGPLSHPPLWADHWYELRPLGQDLFNQIVWWRNISNYRRNWINLITFTAIISCIANPLPLWYIIYMYVTCHLWNEHQVEDQFQAVPTFNSPGLRRSLAPLIPPLAMHHAHAWCLDRRPRQCPRHHGQWRCHRFRSTQLVDSTGHMDLQTSPTCGWQRAPLGNFDLTWCRSQLASHWPVEQHEAAQVLSSIRLPKKIDLQHTSK